MRKVVFFVHLAMETWKMKGEKKECEEGVFHKSKNILTTFAFWFVKSIVSSLVI
jgi:hypothetical protein